MNASGLIFSWVPIVLFFVGVLLIFIWINGVRHAVEKLESQLSLRDGKFATRKDLESVAAAVGQLESEVIRLRDGVSSSAIGVRDAFADGSLSLKKMEDSLGGIRDYLSERGDELRRLQEGHNYAVLKAFCKQIIRCIHQLEVARDDSTAQGAAVLEGVRLDLVDLLDRNGVEEFVPDAGEEYAEMRAIAEVSPQKEVTKDSAQVGLVAEVVRSGFKYVYNDDQVRLILPAQVKVYAKEI